MKDLIKVYGARRTGTNYISFMLMENFKCTLIDDAFSHKHDLPNDYLYEALEKKNAFWVNNVLKKDGEFIPRVGKIGSNNLAIIIMIKNPYAWVDSMIRWVGRACKESELKELYKKMDRSVIIRECNNYNENYSVWFDLEKKFKENVFIFPWEVSLYDAAESLFEGIKDKFELTSLLKKLKYIETKSTNVTNGITDYAFDKSYYTEQKYLKEIPVGLVSQIIDWSNVDYLFNSSNCKDILKKYYVKL